jgi:GT2 family glycosyltransferase
VGAIGLSVIVVTHNSSSVLDGLISSLTRCPPSEPWELIVHDNASKEDVGALFRGQFPHVSVATGSENRGFATGVNAAAGKAGGRWLLLANPDVSWKEGVLDRLTRFLEDHPRAAAVSPRLIFSDGRPQPSVRQFPNHTNIWFSRGTPWVSRLSSSRWLGLYTLSDPGEPTVVDAVSAACLMIRAEAFHAIGGMDPEFFLYVEDTDLCRRFSDHGWDVWIDPTISVTHCWGAAAKRDPKLMAHHRQSVRRYFLKHHAKKRVRNAILFSALSMADWWDRLRERPWFGQGSHSV